MSERASTRGRDDELASASIRPELIERVESGIGSDPRLDVLVENALGIARFRQEHPGADFDPIRVDVRRVTGSLDAVVSLIEQKLPGWGHCYATGWDAEGNCGGFVSPERTVDLTKAIMGVAKTPARALLAACLRAILAGRTNLADATPNPLSEGRERS